MLSAVFVANYRRCESMDIISQFIESITNSSNPIFLYIIGAAIIVVSIIFIRRILQLILILVALSILYVGWSHYTGNPVPIELPQDFSLDALIDFTRNIISKLTDLLPAVPVDDVVDQATDAIPE